jgi:hypothetical protein
MEGKKDRVIAALGQSAHCSDQIFHTVWRILSRMLPRTKKQARAFS